MRYDSNRYKVHCFACGADYDLFDLIRIDYNCADIKEAFQKAKTLYEVPQTDKTTKTNIDVYLCACQAQLTQTSYYKERGLSIETARKFGLGYDPHFQVNKNTYWNTLIIPTEHNSYLARNTNPKATKDQRIRKKNGGGIYDPQKLLLQNFSQKQESKTPNDDFVFVAEGEIDALSILEVGFPAIALGSCANAGKLVKLLSEHTNPPSILLALDTDAVGRKTSAEIMSALHQCNILQIEADICGEEKDPNAALCKDPQKFKERILTEIQRLKESSNEHKKAYSSNSNAAHVESFLQKIQQNAETPIQGTGFSSLDKALEGGLYEGLYIVGAITSSGKTTLLCQMADQIAKTGTDVLFFSLEMSRYELISKSISRLSLRESLRRCTHTQYAETAREIMSGKWNGAQGSNGKQEIIQQSFANYEIYAKRIFVHEGTGDLGTQQVREAVQRHLDMTGHRPVVMIDYLQILAPTNERSSEKQNIDKAILELKRISRDYGLSVIGISSFNRAGYSNAVTMESFKESGAIEYSSDVLLGLQFSGTGQVDFDTMSAKRKDPRAVELIVLKNRNGKVGECVKFSYYPLYNYFKEV